MTLYFADSSVTLHHGDALDVLRELPDRSVDCCVTSPPYYGLRDYGVPDQQGLEATPADYVAGMRAVFAEIRRVIAADGTCWLNLGDSYASTSSNNGGYSASSTLAGFTSPDTKGRAANGGGGHKIAPGLAPKNLLGIPWRVAFALQDDGWILRNAIVWHKPNAMPESVTDRLSCRYETVFMFSRSRSYWFDLEQIREPATKYEGKSWEQRKAAGAATRSNRGMNATSNRIDTVFAPNQTGRNPGDVWTIPTQPFGEAHFAVMPVKLAERCIQAGCKPGGIVLDPYSGSGTTGLAAGKHGRRYVGVDLSADYLDMSLRTRLAQSALLDGDPA